MIGWKAWYTKGRTFDSFPYKWKELPEIGCLAVVVFYTPPYKDKFRGGDWWYLKDGKICMIPGRNDGTFAEKPDAYAKQGCLVSDSEWDRIYNEVNEICR